MTKTSSGAWTVQTGRDVASGQVCEAVAIDRRRQASFGIRGFYDGQTLLSLAGPGWERFDDRHVEVAFVSRHDAVWHGAASGHGDEVLVRLPWQDARSMLAKLESGDRFEVVAAGDRAPAIVVSTDGLGEALGRVQSCMWNTVSPADRLLTGNTYAPLP